MDSDNDSDNDSINSDYISSNISSRNTVSAAPVSLEHSFHHLSLQNAHDLLEQDQQQVISKQELPPHACAYCGCHAPCSVVKCNGCDKWFCNTRNSSGSHIITHLVMSRHTNISLHPDSDLGDSTLECYNCGNKNIFVLGFVTAKEDTVVVMLCRLPCAQKPSTEWDTSKWESLIENRQLLTWLVPPPSQEEVDASRKVTATQISKLETQWRSNKDATIEDLEKKIEEEEKIEPILHRYTDAYQYQKAFAPLIELEAEYDKQLRESQALEHISVKWSISLGNRHLASFSLATFESKAINVAVGDEMVLHFNPPDDEPWKGNGYIVRLPGSFSEEFTLELMPNKKSPPTDYTEDFRAEFVWKGTTYDRMQQSLKEFAINENSVSPFLYHSILGHDVVPVEFNVEIPADLSIPNFPKLNTSQTNAIRNVLTHPLSLIQGPPGTGKTVTSATIIYHLSKITKQRILVCAPSNIAVDHLAEKLETLGLSVVRIVARSREDVDSSIEDLSLHNIIKKKANGGLKKLLKLKEDMGELSSEDYKIYFKLLRKAEKDLLKKVDVICTTCVGAGDKRLSAFEFPIVLIDESTQASEPECLIPIVKGARQVILVGDHKQLGPVILEKRAAEAGLQQSLFERLILIGHMPIRLEVQYRMNPCLSEFSSNIFYDGSLQNGVTREDRLITNDFPWPIQNNPMMFWANYGKEEISFSGTSYLNRVEAMNCEKLVSRLFKDGIKPEQIGIITPYEGQRAYIVQYMTLNGSMSGKEDDYAEVEVTSVDAFQGREKDFIILTCVRANAQQSIGFLRDPRRMNVALTRAKYGLIILGNPRSLSRNALWNNLLLHYRQNGCLVEGPLDNLQLSSVQLRVPKSKYTHKQNLEFLNNKSQFNTPANTNQINNNTNFFNNFNNNFNGMNDFDSTFSHGWGGYNNNNNNNDNGFANFFQNNQQSWPTMGSEQVIGSSQSDRMKDSEFNGYY